MKLMFNGGVYKVSLPKSIIEMVLQWKAKDDLKIECDGKQIIITKESIK